MDLLAKTRLTSLGRNFEVYQKDGEKFANPSGLSPRNGSAGAHSSCGPFLQTPRAAR